MSSSRAMGWLRNCKSMGSRLGWGGVRGGSLTPFFLPSPLSTLSMHTHPHTYIETYIYIHTNTSKTTHWLNKRKKTTTKISNLSPSLDSHLIMKIQSRNLIWIFLMFISFFPWLVTSILQSVVDFHDLINGASWPPSYGIWFLLLEFRPMLAVGTWWLADDLFSVGGFVLGCLVTLSLSCCPRKPYIIPFLYTYISKSLSTCYFPVRVEHLSPRSPY